MKQMEWQLVPAVPTLKMLAAMGWEGDVDIMIGHANPMKETEDHYKAMLAAAPEPPHLSMTKEEAATFQDWRGMDGATAFHLIERHANGWCDTARMMDAWLAANVSPSNAIVSGLPLEKG